MIRTVRLRNFKCFDDATFRLGRLTLLAGQNGTGKSSLIQGLLSLRSLGCLLCTRSPHGPAVDIDSFGDIFCRRAADGDRIVLRVLYEDGMRICGGVSARGHEFCVKDSDFVDRTEHKDVVGQLSLMRESIFYWSADRDDPSPAWTVHLHEGDLVASALRHPTTSTKTLLDQTNAWLAAANPGIEVSVDSVSGAELAVGFRMSPAVPIMVALLAARNDDLVLVEHPEAHLHPVGQTMIAELAGRAVADGRQVILETHSEHVLDRIRIAVAEGLVPADDVVVYMFRRDNAGVHASALEVRADGTMDSWPDGFFDQQERNLARLIALRRGRGGG